MFYANRKRLDLPNYSGYTGWSAHTFSYLQSINFVVFSDFVSENKGQVVYVDLDRSSPHMALKTMGPVVQSVVSLTSSLRVILLTVLADSIHRILIFFAEKMWVAFALQKLLTFFSEKFQHICVLLDVNFNELLINDIVSFELLGPCFQVGQILKACGMIVCSPMSVVFYEYSGSIAMHVYHTQTPAPSGAHFSLVKINKVYLELDDIHGRRQIHFMLKICMGIFCWKQS